MKTYTAEERAKIRANYAPAGAVCRVITLRHRYAEEYENIGTRFFNSFQEGMDFASEAGTEVDLPEHAGDAAFSTDGKTIRVFTFFGPEP